MNNYLRVGLYGPNMVTDAALTERVSPKIESPRRLAVGQRAATVTEPAMHYYTSAPDKGTDRDAQDIELPASTPDAHGAIVVIR